MKRKCLAVILGMLLLSLSACAAGDQDESPFLIETRIGSGTGDATGVENSAAGSGIGNAGNVAGAGNSATGLDTGNTGTESSAAGSGAGSLASGSGAGSVASGTGTGSSSASTAADAEGYRSIYRQVVTDSDENTVFSLIYLNDDDIPELVASRDGESYSIYTIKDGALHCMVDSLFTVELTYFEQNGIVVAFSRWNGGGDEGGYGRDYYQVSESGTIGDSVIGANPDLSYSYNAVYDENGAYTGEGITDYFYEGQQIDEATYLEMSKTLGITEGGDRPCMENAVRREEMLEQLSIAGEDKR